MRQKYQLADYFALLSPISYAERMDFALCAKANC